MNYLILFNKIYQIIKYYLKYPIFEAQIWLNMREIYAKNTNIPQLK